MKKLIYLLCIVFASCETDYTIKLNDSRVVHACGCNSGGEFNVGDSVTVRGSIPSSSVRWIVYAPLHADTLIYDRYGDPIEWRKGIITAKE